MDYDKFYKLVVTFACITIIVYTSAIIINVLTQVILSR